MQRPLPMRRFALIFPYARKKERVSQVLNMP